MNSFCISGWPLQDQGPPAHTVRVRDGSAVHDSGALCLAFAALCVNCCHNNTNRAKTKRATNCQHDSNSNGNSSNSNRDNKQLAAIVAVAADVAAFAVYCLLGVIFIGVYYLHIPARSGVGAGVAHCCRRRCRCCRYCCCCCCCCRLYYVIASSAPTAAPLYRHPSCTLCRN